MSSTIHEHEEVMKAESENNTPKIRRKKGIALCVLRVPVLRRAQTTIEVIQNEKFCF